MPDNPVTVRGIDYKSVFPFTLIFRSFRVAVHPSKLILAVLAMILIYFSGSILDAIWPSRAVPGEIAIYAASRGERNAGRLYHERVGEARREAQAEYERMLVATGKSKEQARFGDIKWTIIHNRDKDVKAARERYENVRKSADEALANAPEDKKSEARTARDEALAAAEQAANRAVTVAYSEASDQYKEARAARGAGLFETFVGQQVGLLNNLIAAVRDWRWIGREGVIDICVRFFTVGPVWAIRHHPIFFSLFFLAFLSIWSVFGGAIARIAAVHLAREEKISIRQALRFSTSKFLSFFSAPIIPLFIVLGLGLVVAVGGLITNIPFLGPIVVGALFFLALAAGFVMALVILGLGGGFNLMYPTIAVEGSDSFDAISRSFSYLYARPWRLAFYSAVAIVYGALCYMFIRYFLDLLLMLAHFFAGMLVFGTANNNDPLWNVIWPGPTITGRLSYSVDFFALGAGQSLGAFFIWCWVHLLAALLGGFAISFFFVASTSIYYLMRKEVDATELDDVYLEQSEEDFGETLPAASVPDATAPAPPAAG
ncbi:MAG TPA: hypothetical protein PLD59_12285 [Tepidisphaeraceae bacterium]|nr:hypothetical protein [Tepidisphaeraceae bacterium]